MKLTDVCVNLTNSQLRDDVDAIIQRAKAAGVERMLITATDIESTKAALLLCCSGQRYCTAGVHPHDATNYDQETITSLKELVGKDDVRAVGETGLDFNRNFSPVDAQLAAFESQIEIAQGCNKTLFVHDRESQGEVLRILSDAAAKTPLPPVIIHCFTGTREELRRYLANDYYIGITGWIADTQRGGELREMVADIPLNRLLIETDAPFLRPHNVPKDFLQQHNLPAAMKRQNEPALLPFVLTAIGACRNEALDEIAAATENNAARLFGFT